MYVLNGKYEEHKLQKPQAKVHKCVAEVFVQDCSLWHKRLDNPTTQVLKLLDILKHNKDVEGLNNYHICPLAKQTRLTFPISKTRVSQCFDIVHIDL